MCAPTEETLRVVFVGLARSRGRKARVTKYGPFIFVVIEVHQSEGLDSAIGSQVSRYPALLMRISRLLTSFEIVFAAASTLASSVTSSFTTMVFGSDLLAFWAADLISGIRDSREERAAMIIVDAPAFAKLRAVARPTPFDAPVIRTDLPDKLAFDGSIAEYVS